MKAARKVGQRLREPPRGSVLSYGITIGLVLLATRVCWVAIRQFDHANIIMVYLLVVALVSSMFGVAEAVLASVLSVAAFDLTFVEPQGTFAVADAQYLLTFVIMLAVALLISGLTLRTRRRAAESAERQVLTEALFLLSRDLSQNRDERELAQLTADSVREVFGTDTAILLRNSAAVRSRTRFEENDTVVKFMNEHRRAGRGTDFYPSSKGVYVQVRGTGGTMGVLGMIPIGIPTEAQLEVLETFANTLGLALERVGFARQSQEARVLAEGERIRNALLSSISHDLRTPLTVIAGAASSLQIGQGDSRQLIETIVDQSQHMNLQIQNLLDMTRLQSGQIQPKLEWHLIEEVVGSAIARTTDLIGGRQVRVDLPQDLPLLWIDADLVEKVFVNLLENVVSHAPIATQIVIDSNLMTSTLRINLTDNGPGIAKGEESRIFERFAQPQALRGQGGFGLGLAIARAIMRLHGGRIWAENASMGGAVFHLEFPLPTTQPEVPRG